MEGKNEKERCCICDNMYENDNMYETVYSEFVCRDCFENEDFIFCNHCGLATNDYICAKDCESFFCSEECAEAHHYYECHECHEFYCIDNLNEVEDELYCLKCGANLGIEYCGGCDEYRFNCQYHDVEGCWLCENCFGRAKKSKKIKSYHTAKSCCEFVCQSLIEEQNKVDLFFGFELEVENKSEIIENDFCAEKLEKIVNLEGEEILFFEEDGSLNAGFEIISQPMSLNLFRSRYEKFEKMLKFLSENGFLSHDTNSCGLHVHFSNILSEAEKVKLSCLMCKFETELIKFSRRENVQIEQWCDFESMKKIHVKILNVGVDFEEIEENRMHDFYYYLHENRYQALNLKNTDTCEVRLFRGTLNFESFVSCIELVSLLVGVVRNFSFEELMNLKSFEELVSLSDCEILKKYVKERKI